MTSPFEGHRADQDLTSEPDRGSSSVCARRSRCCTMHRCRSARVIGSLPQLRLPSIPIRPRGRAPHVPSAARAAQAGPRSSAWPRASPRCRRSTATIDHATFPPAARVAPQPSRSSHAFTPRRSSSPGGGHRSWTESSSLAWSHVKQTVASSSRRCGPRVAAAPRSGRRVRDRALDADRGHGSGLAGPLDYEHGGRRLVELAEWLGRTEAAVRQRASKLRVARLQDRDGEPLVLTARCWPGDPPPWTG